MASALELKTLACCGSHHVHMPSPMLLLWQLLVTICLSQNGTERPCHTLCSTSTWHPPYHSLRRQPIAPLANDKTPFPLTIVRGKRSQIGDHAKPQRSFGLYTPREAEWEGATPSNTDACGSARADRERRTSPAANAREPAGTAPSVTEAPTKNTKAARTEHTASHQERGQPCRKDKGSRS
jgi:hypothetical protein